MDDNRETLQIHGDFTPEQLRVQAKLVNGVSELTQKAIFAIGSNNMADNVYTAALGVIGAMHVLALLVGRGDTTNERCNPISTLFASILASQIAPTVQGDMTEASFGPQHVVLAKRMVEQLYGKSAEEFLNGDMCIATEEACKGKRPLLPSFERQCAFVPVQSRTIN